MGDPEKLTEPVLLNELLKEWQAQLDRATDLEEKDYYENLLGIYGMVIKKRDDSGGQDPAT